MPIVGVPRNHVHKYPTMCVLYFLSSSPQLFSTDVLEGIAAHRTQIFSFQVSQLIYMSLNDESASFVDHGAVYNTKEESHSGDSNSIVLAL